MHACKPELVLNRPRPGCKVSIILLDWGVRESYHSLEYLNRQTVERSEYELIWLEFYDRKPDGLREAVASMGADGPALDKWIVAGYSQDYIYNKHRLYNLGILASAGEICVICDSDAIFTPTFVEKVIAGLTETPRAVLHLDEVRNNNRRLYPFCHPSLKDVLGKGCINWHGTVTRGLDNSTDMLHEANYGACMAARRTDLLAIGGADEHPDYLGYICGPYEMTFRLVNHGLEERWLRDEYLYHTWHPNASGNNTDYHGPEDGMGMSLRALRARSEHRVFPYEASPWVARASVGEALDLDELLRLMAEKEEPTWNVGHQLANGDGTFLIEHDFQGFNLFLHKRQWYGLKLEEGAFEPKRARRYRNLLQAESLNGLHQLIIYYNQLPTRLWDRLWIHPPHRLPIRILRRVGKELARWV
jgi:hypothetical protein